jgi:hypothetical protein
MKLTKQRLKKIIKEELEAAMEAPLDTYNFSIHRADQGTPHGAPVAFLLNVPHNRLSEDSIKSAAANRNNNKDQFLKPDQDLYLEVAGSTGIKAFDLGARLMEPGTEPVIPKPPPVIDLAPEADLPRAQQSVVPG